MHIPHPLALVLVCGHLSKTKFTLMKKLITVMTWLTFFTACHKQDEWLDIKSKKADITPSKLEHYQSILDYTTYMNDSYPALPLISADNYYVTYTSLMSEGTYAKYVYTWDMDPYQGTTIISDWNSPYIIVEYANITLDGLGKIQRDDTNKTVWDNIKGSALFYRAYAFYQLVNEFAKPYDPTTAATDPGIPLRLSSDINQPSTRATIQVCYDKIIADLKEAENLLPQTALYQTRPSKTAVTALLARVYLNISDYANAKTYADKAITAKPDLLDLNTLNVSAAKSFPVFPNHPEIVFYASSTLFALTLFYSQVDSSLLQSYDTNDLRLKAFYNSSAAGTGFKGQYTGGYNPFGGIAINEIYLIRAEANARLGSTQAALQDLNTLLIKRWKKGSFQPIQVNNAQQALDTILAERRKELPFTGTLRWEDLRRLNKENRYKKILTRLLNGQVYQLNPGDNRYTMPIPDSEIKLSGLEQNPR